MNNKVALVTGGSSGIGAATVVAFAREGTKVVLASRGKTKAEETLQKVRKAGGDATWIEADVCDARQVERRCVQQRGKRRRRRAHSRDRRGRVEQDNQRLSDQRLALYEIRNQGHAESRRLHHQ
jgi:NAD(P)-dependent dehydrogenase (short-subunit alcohol dehydrogenase family)